MSLLVLALNPSMDVEWQVATVQWEEKNLIEQERRWPGGKGVNVARWLKYLGNPAKLIVPTGGDSGRELQGGLQREKLPAKIISITGNTRANIIVTSNSKRQLRFNPSGPDISATEWKAIIRAIKAELPSAEILILSGSLPRGVSPSTYAELLELAHHYKIRTVLDCDGTAFKSAVGAKPFLVKPNEYELAQWSGKKLTTEPALIRAALQLSQKTGGWVLVSRGGRGGLLINEKSPHFFKAAAPQIKVLNTVGAGDAMLAAAAWQMQKTAPPTEWLRWGIGTGSAATQCLAGILPKRGFVKEISTKVRVEAVLRG